MDILARWLSDDITWLCVHWSTMELGQLARQALDIVATQLSSEITWVSVHWLRMELGQFVVSELVHTSLL